MTKVYYRILNENDEDIVSSFVAEHYLPNETTIKCFRLGSDLIRKYALYYTVKISTININVVLTQNPNLTSLSVVTNL